MIETTFRFTPARTFGDVLTIAGAQAKRGEKIVISSTDDVPGMLSAGRIEHPDSQIVVRAGDGYWPARGKFRLRLQWSAAQDEAMIGLQSRFIALEMPWDRFTSERRMDFGTRSIWRNIDMDLVQSGEWFTPGAYWRFDLPGEFEARSDGAAFACIVRHADVYGWTERAIFAEPGWPVTFERPDCAECWLVSQCGAMTVNGRKIGPLQFVRLDSAEAEISVESDRTFIGFIWR
jgi:hypothetical protein